MHKSATVVGALAVLLTACGQESSGARKGPTDTAKNPVDSRAIARAIDSRLEKGAPLRVRVSCPRDIEWEEGRTFRCLVKGPEGRSQAVVTLGETGDHPGGRSSGSGRTVQGEFSWTVD